MGRTPKPLQIWVDETIYQAEVFEPLAKQGHLIVTGQGLGDYVMTDFDLMLGPQCWRMTPDLLKHLDLAVAGARALRYPKKEK